MADAPKTLFGMKLVVSRAVREEVTFALIAPYCSAVAFKDGSHLIGDQRTALRLVYGDAAELLFA